MPSPFGSVIMMDGSRGREWEEVTAGCLLWAIVDDSHIPETKQTYSTD